jgi:DNA-binding GntR family transcriptional regulator
MMLDPRADRPLFKQLADLIRGQIERGDLGPGQSLPTEAEYARHYNLSRDTVRRALAVLRNEGMIVTRHPDGSRVRPAAAHTIVQVTQAVVSARMPTDPERHQLGLSDGVPLIVVRRKGHEPEIYPGDRTIVEGT